MATMLKRPPSRRNFQVHDFLKEGGSTREAATRFGVSQTRVRQLERQVLQWAAETLPTESEAEVAGLVRVAESVAVDRLDYFYQQTMEQWHATHQVKFLNQAIRVTQAAARLPSRSCEIDAAAADLLEEPEEEWEEGSGVRGQESARREPGPVVAALETMPPPERDCSPHSQISVPAQQPVPLVRDASPRAASKLSLLLADEAAGERERSPAARTLLRPPIASGQVHTGITPEDLGLSVDDAIQRLERRRRRAK